MKICVIGLGYVGAVTAVCLARDGHEVTGVDLDRSKVELLAAGKPPIIEEGLGQVTQDAVSSGRLRVTDALDASVAGHDLIFVCVGTPSAPNGSQSLVAVERVAEELGRLLRGCAGFPVVVLRSTVPPGTTDTVFAHLLERASGQRVNEAFGLCFMPEFLREGSSVRDYYQPPFTIVGSDSPRAVEVVRRLFGGLPGEFIPTATRSAELVKLACNAFHALKVSFANEIGRLGRSLGVDSRAVMDLACRDRSLNISTAYLRPGFAYGGSCLPKDLRAMLYLAKRHDVELPMLAGVAASNALHIEHAAALVKAQGSRQVGLIGLSFKPGTDDLRESPLVALAEHLIGKGFQLKVYDPAVNLARLMGANKRYIEQTIPHIGSMLTDDLDQVVRDAGVLVVGFRNAEVDRALGTIGPDGPPVVDLVGIEAAARSRRRYEGICW